MWAFGSRDNFIIRTRIVSKRDHYLIQYKIITYKEEEETMPLITIHPVSFLGVWTRDPLNCPLFTEIDAIIKSSKECNLREGRDEKCAILSRGPPYSFYDDDGRHTSHMWVGEGKPSTKHLVFQSRCPLRLIIITTHRTIINALCWRRGSCSHHRNFRSPGLAGRSCDFFRSLTQRSTVALPYPSPQAAQFLPSEEYHPPLSSPNLNEALI